VCDIDTKSLLASNSLSAFLIQYRVKLTYIGFFSNNKPLFFHYLLLQIKLKNVRKKVVINQIAVSNFKV